MMVCGGGGVVACDIMMKRTGNRRTTRYTCYTSPATPLGFFEILIFCFLVDDGHFTRICISSGKSA
jgi:hypothetical protein